MPKYCKLCLAQKALIKSHIIPEFMYKELYDKNHKLRSFTLTGKNKFDYIKRPSSGEYEFDLLCFDCDNKLIGKYEDYGKKILYGKFISENLKPICTNYIGKDHKISIIENIDYKKFKIFLLSILWKSSISSNDFFKFVQLGVHEEILRKMILNEDPGNKNDYPVSIFSFLNSKLLNQEYIIQPIRKKIRSGLNIYKFVIGNFIYIFSVNSNHHSLPDYITECTINPNNELKIIQIPDEKLIDSIL